MLQLLIIDDEAHARQHLRQLLNAHPGVNIIAEAASASEARRIIEQSKPYALFLDIMMPGGDGFSLLRGLKEVPKVVFVTGHPSRALEAFDVNAVDYLLKPVRAERLALALDRLRSSLPSDTPWQRKDRICLRTPERTLVTHAESIIALEAEGDFTRIFIEGESPLLICHPLSYYEKTLPAPPFLRLDRSLMINRDRVKKLKPLAHDETDLHLIGLENPISLGRAASRRLTETLETINGS